MLLLRLKVLRAPFKWAAHLNAISKTAKDQTSSREARRFLHHRAASVLGGQAPGVSSRCWGPRGRPCTSFLSPHSPHSAFQMPLLRGTAVTDRHRNGVLGARRVGPFQALPKGHLVQPVVLPKSPLLRPACPVALHKPWRV